MHVGHTNISNSMNRKGQFKQKKNKTNKNASDSIDLNTSQFLLHFSKPPKTDAIIVSIDAKEGKCWRIMRGQSEIGFSNVDFSWTTVQNLNYYNYGLISFTRTMYSDMNWNLCGSKEKKTLGSFIHIRKHYLKIFTEFCAKNGF